ncbi:MAG: carboxypeptidase regulatory-like domain-containing protein [Terriglobia bacterium]
MTGRRKALIGVAVVMAAGAAAAAVFLVRANKRQPISLKGTVIMRASEANRELPIAGVEITAADGMAAGECRSASSGFFELTLRKGIRLRQPVVLEFRRSGYQPLNLRILAGGSALYVARMTQIDQPEPVNPHRPETAVSNISVRYSVKATRVVNVGSAVKTFQVVNTGNAPCNGRKPCSPNGRWKAAIASASLDADEGNVFRNARVSCIAGPCPFTKIVSDHFSGGGRFISVSALDWSDTATFLFEAEVFHPMASDSVRVSYPVIFGRALNFTVPAAAEGVCIKAEIDGGSIVFPLGPDLLLRWAGCNARVNPDQTKVYRCELKPGFRFG